MTVDPEAARAMAAAYTDAWNSGSPEAVASFYAPDGHIVINGGSPWTGRKAICEMATGFFADVPDLKLVCDAVRCAGNHVAYFWTFTGTHAATKNPLRVVGWEEWDLDSDVRVAASRGWYDAADYARQTAAR
ncbi:MAG: SgcJ/EcaC family oxidoreductase [Alphaproteobacteria bacterium]|nr:SgcJ/EcaC family oxidoreductase [Alphaproteobacteria bacterium]